VSRYDEMERMSRDAKRDMLMLTADLGKENGMRAGVEILRALAKGRKSISTAELMDAALAMEAAASKLDEKTNSKIRTAALQRPPRAGDNS
jgi:hypothetical protein